MTYLQQQILIPASNLDEITFLNSVVRAINTDPGEALRLCMERLVMLENYSGARLADYRPDLEAKPQ